MSKTVISNASNPIGKVQLILDGVPTGSMVKLDDKSQAIIQASSHQVGQHTAVVNYIPSPETGFLSSRSDEVKLTVIKPFDLFWLLVILLIAIILVLIIRSFQKSGK